MSISSIYCLIMYYDAIQNDQFLSQVINFNDIIAVICISHLFNIAQTIFFGCSSSIHIFGINLSIHKYCYLYLYIVLNHIKSTGCKNRAFLNCTNDDVNLDNNILDNAQQYITWGIYGLVTCELLSGLNDRHRVWYFSKNIVKEIVLSFLFINTIAILYCIVFGIMCIACACLNDANTIYLNELNNGTKRHKPRISQQSDNTQQSTRIKKILEV